MPILLVLFVGYSLAFGVNPLNIFGGLIGTAANSISTLAMPLILGGVAISVASSFLFQSLSKFSPVLELVKSAFSFIMPAAVVIAGLSFAAGVKHFFSPPVTAQRAGLFGHLDNALEICRDVVNFFKGFRAFAANNVNNTDEGFHPSGHRNEGHAAAGVVHEVGRAGLAAEERRARSQERGWGAGSATRRNIPPTTVNGHNTVLPNAAEARDHYAPTAPLYEDDRFLPNDYAAAIPPVTGAGNRLTEEERAVQEAIRRSLLER